MDRGTAIRYLPLGLLVVLVVITLMLLFGKPPISTLVHPDCTPLPSGAVCEGV